MHTKCSTRFQTRHAHVAVIGLGYVGLPLAVSFAQASYGVTGIDQDRRKMATGTIAALQHGKGNIR